MLPQGGTDGGCTAAAMTTRARRRRAGRLWAAGSAAGGGQRRAPRSPPRRRRASHAPAGFAAGRSGCASHLGPLLGGQPDARDAGPAPEWRVQAPVAANTMADATERHADVLDRHGEHIFIAFSAGSERMPKATAAADVRAVFESTSPACGASAKVGRFHAIRKWGVNFTAISLQFHFN